MESPAVGRPPLNTASEFASPRRRRYTVAVRDKRRGSRQTKLIIALVVAMLFTVLPALEQFCDASAVPGNPHSHAHGSPAMPVQTFALVVEPPAALPTAARCSDALATTTHAIFVPPRL